MNFSLTVSAETSTGSHAYLATTSLGEIDDPTAVSKTVVRSLKSATVMRSTVTVNIMTLVSKTVQRTLVPA